MRARFVRCSSRSDRSGARPERARLRAALTDATAAHANVTVHWGDVMRIDLGSLQPAPGKMVANLPYGVAAGALAAGPVLAEQAAHKGAPAASTSVASKDFEKLKKLAGEWTRDPHSRPCGASGASACGPIATSDRTS